MLYIMDFNLDACSCRVVDAFPEESQQVTAVLPSDHSWTIAATLGR